MQKQHLHIAGARKSSTPTAIKSLLKLCIDGILDTISSILTAPCSTKRRILQYKSHFSALKAVGFHRILIADVFRILPLDKHFCKTHSIGLRIDFLTKQANIRRRIVTLNEVVSGGKHTACATCLIQNGDDLTIIENIVAALSQQYIDHELDDITPGVVVTSLSIFRELPDQFLKDISHLYIVDSAWIEVQLRERLDNRK